MYSTFSYQYKTHQSKPVLFRHLENVLWQTSTWWLSVCHKDTLISKIPRNCQNKLFFGVFLWQKDVSQPWFILSGWYVFSILIQRIIFTNVFVSACAKRCDIKKIFSEVKQTTKAESVFFLLPALLILLSLRLMDSNFKTLYFQWTHGVYVIYHNPFSSRWREHTNHVVWYCFLHLCCWNVYKNRAKYS